MSTSILIAEDDVLLGSMLSSLLARQEGFKVVGTVRRGHDVAPAVLELRPDVVVLDLHLLGQSGHEVLEHLAEVRTTVHVLVLSGDEAEETQMEVAQRGARGFLGKSQGDSLPAALKAVVNGQTWFPSQVVDRILAEYPVLARKHRAVHHPLGKLSETERQILMHVVQGATNPEIASDLYMSVSSVKVKLRSVLEKLGLKNRTEAAAFAVREGLFVPPRTSQVEQ